MKRKLYWCILGVILYLFFEIACGVSLSLQKNLFGVTYAPLQTALSAKYKGLLTRIINNDTSYLTYSTPLGWTIKRNGTSPLAQANSLGIRANREYALTTPMDVLRVACFGDSYTHSDGVKNTEVWTERLQVSTDNLEVMNFGVPGYGLDQAYLRYQHEGKAFQPDLVMIGFMSENIFRHVNVFRPFYLPGTSDVFTKPRFILQDGQLVLLENPMQELSQYKELLTRPETVLPRIGIHDNFYQSHYKQDMFDILPSVRLGKILLYKAIRKYKFSDIITGSPMYVSADGYYNEESEAYQITLKIFDVFYADVIANNSLPLILIFPNTWDIARYRENGTETYAPLLAYFDQKQYEYLNLMAAFEQDGRQFQVKELCDGHYTPLGNEIVARYLAEYLNRKDAETRSF